MYLGTAGTAAKQKKKRLAGIGDGGGGGGGGGGATKSVSVADSSSGNYDNAVKIGIFNFSSNTYGYSGGIIGGADSTLGTASSPTRTTQSIDVSVSDYVSEYNNAGSGGAMLVIGGYIRNNNFVSAGNYRWEPLTLQSSTMSNGGASISVLETKVGHQNNQDNTSMTTGASANLGIYSSTAFGSLGTSYYVITITHGGGRGAATLPGVGDNFTFRLTVSDRDEADNTLYSALHEVTINFT